jgi:hypothetical protein
MKEWNDLFKSADEVRKLLRQMNRACRVKKNDPLSSIDRAMRMDIFRAHLSGGNYEIVVDVSDLGHAQAYLVSPLYAALINDVTAKGWILGDIKCQADKPNPIIIFSLRMVEQARPRKANTKKRQVRR